ncbi:hypothetical protein [Amycolatopsis methanolica]|uniref:Uncharacterized protein n=1 Tax=Amycolatopsis methanolica 239 TaxID=1068978 RepID=A0A076N0H8_AMYME|nr:hypothetical protein [Amycolatopsis methanolica]AIJ26343.1 hypothetical protein AMETH_6251 [Amycolatopsis methanolica 239]AIJ26402.1 hypothetical protein AMETH_6310 [Amycolatopsis methanolica 239]
MRMGLIGTSSNDTGCPNLWATERGTLVVQGTTVTDPEALAALRERGLPAHESAVEVPRELLPFIALQALEQLPFADADRPGFTIDPDSAAKLEEVLRELAAKATTTATR